MSETACQWCGGNPRADGCCQLCLHLRPGRRINHVEEPPSCPDCALRLAAIPGELADAFSHIPWLLQPSSGKAGEVRAKDPDPPMPLGDIHDLADLRLPPLGPFAAERLAEYPQDQIGRLSVAGVLWGHVRVWIDLRQLGEAGPEPTVPQLCGWLAVRTPWAIENLPAVNEYAEDVAGLLGLLLAMVGRSEPCPDCGGKGCEACVGRGYVPIQRPQPLPGVPCPRCKHVSLSREPDGDVACGWEGCGNRWRPDEYDLRQKAMANAVRRGQLKPREDVTS